MTSYELLSILALSINWRDRQQLVMCAAVVAGVTAPVPAANFYLLCILGETVIGLIAYQSRAYGSYPTVVISAALAATHAIGWNTNGYPPESPYHILVKICEHAELVVCILYSNSFLKRPNKCPKNIGNI